VSRQVSSLTSGYPGTIPVDVITGPRPWDCINCTWSMIKEVYTLKYVHKGCPVHGQIAVRGSAAVRPFL
jgi:hypothetical protein